MSRTTTTVSLRYINNDWFDDALRVVLLENGLDLDGDVHDPRHGSGDKDALPRNALRHPHDLIQDL